jgi:hypothetical protein
LVKIETKPVVLNKHSNVAVCLGDVFNESSLSFAKNFNKHSDKVGSLVHVDNDSLVKFTECLSNGRLHLQTALFDLLVLLNVVDVGICQFVCFRFLKVLQPTRSLKEPQIKQVTRDYFQPR